MTLFFLALMCSYSFLQDRAQRPSVEPLKTHSSSYELRSNVVEEKGSKSDSIIHTRRPNGTRSKSALPLDSRDADSLGRANAVSISGNVVDPIGNGVASDDPYTRYSPTGEGRYQYYETQVRAGPVQDDLIYAMQNVGLNDTYRTQGMDPRQNSSASVDRVPFGYPLRDSTSPYPAYYAPRAPYAEPYVDYTDPLSYFRAGVVNGAHAAGDSLARDSGYAPASPTGFGPDSHLLRGSSQSSQWGARDYSQSIHAQSGNGHPSGIDAYPYSAPHSASYGLAPGAPFSTHQDRHQSIANTQQMLAMRSMRPQPEYIAPGPSNTSHIYKQAPLGYSAYGGSRGRHAEDMGRPVRSALLEDFRANRNRSWELFVRSFLLQILTTLY